MIRFSNMDPLFIELISLKLGINHIVEVLDENLPFKTSVTVLNECCQALECR